MRSDSKRIIKAVSAVSRVPFEQIMSRSRQHQHVKARQVAQFMLVAELQKSGCAVARLFGRDHTTVMSNIDVVNRDIRNGGPRGEIVNAARALLDTTPAPRDYGKAPNLPLHVGVVSKTAKRVTKCGWVEADGALVVAP